MGIPEPDHPKLLLHLSRGICSLCPSDQGRDLGAVDSADESVRDDPSREEQSWPGGKSSCVSSDGSKSHRKRRVGTCKGVEVSHRCNSRRSKVTVLKGLLPGEEPGTCQWQAHAILLPSQDSVRSAAEQALKQFGNSVDEYRGRIFFSPETSSRALWEGVEILADFGSTVQTFSSKPRRHAACVGDTHCGRGPSS